jgi:hypothetical protein
VLSHAREFLRVLSPSRAPHQTLGLAARDGLISQNNSFFAHHQIEDFIVQLLNHQLIDFPL